MLYCAVRIFIMFFKKLNDNEKKAAEKHSIYYFVCLWKRKSKLFKLVLNKILYRNSFIHSFIKLC